MTDNLTDAHLLNALDQIRNMKSERATLRDQFAMAALTGIVSRENFSPRLDKAAIAYELADAMLAAREQKK